MVFKYPGENNISPSPGYVISGGKCEYIAVYEGVFGVGCPVYTVAFWEFCINSLIMEMET